MIVCFLVFVVRCFSDYFNPITPFTQPPMSISHFIIRYYKIIYTSEYIFHLLCCDKETQCYMMFENKDQSHVQPQYIV